MICFTFWDNASTGIKICFILFAMIFDVLVCVTIILKCVFEYGNIIRFCECSLFVVHLLMTFIVIYLNFKHRRHLQQLLLITEDPLFAVGTEAEETIARRVLGPFKVATYIGLFYAFSALVFVYVIAQEKIII